MTSSHAHTANSSRLLNPWGPLTPFLSAWKNRQLIFRLARREIEARYRGSLLGIAWTILAPVIMLLIYAFVFTVVFETKWEVKVGEKSHFVLLLFCGLILFNLFSECINRAPGLMLANANYIKKVVFPLEILPWVALVVALFNAFISYAILGVAYIVLLGAPPNTAVYLPLMVLPTLFYALGLTLFFASVGVFIRDLQQLMGLITTALLFMSPLFYPLSALPERFRRYIELSPLSVAIEESRRVLFFGEAPNLQLWMINLLISCVFVWLGSAWFMKTKKGFADVI